MKPSAHKLPPLLSPQELEQLRLRVLEIRDRQRRGHTAPDIGEHRSAFRGQGMELHDIRPYQAGDDIRHLDWRATARSGKPVTKVFVEERARRLLLIIDRRPPMLFGTRHELKATTAARAAAMLTFSAIAAREQVSGMTLETGQPVHFPPARNTDQALSLLTAVSSAPDATVLAETGPPAIFLSRAIHDALHRYDSNTTLFIISDFHDVHATDPVLWSILGERFDAHAVRIVDQAEEQLEDIGLIRLRSPQSGQTVLVDTHDHQVRQTYAEAAARRQQELAQLFAASSIKSCQLYTHQDPFAILGAWL